MYFMFNLYLLVEKPRSNFCKIYLNINFVPYLYYLYFVCQSIGFNPIPLTGLGLTCLMFINIISYLRQNREQITLLFIILFFGFCTTVVRCNQSFFNFQTIMALYPRRCGMQIVQVLATNTNLFVGNITSLVRKKYLPDATKKRLYSTCLKTLICASLIEIVNKI